MSNLTPQQRSLLQIVSEDLAWIRTDWVDSVDEPFIRRGSVTLRKLLIDEDLQKAWNLLHRDKRCHVVAPRPEYLLDNDPQGLIELLFSGGCEFAGFEMCLMMINQGKKAVPTPTLVAGQSITDHNFTLRMFREKCGVLLEKRRISRQTVIKYVANKLGGAHLGSVPREKHAQSFGLLDKYMDRSYVTPPSESNPNPHLACLTPGRNKPPPAHAVRAIYLEILSYGQRLVRSPEIQAFMTDVQSLLAV